METNIEIKKQFALEQIAPYYHNPELCGYENGHCKYLTTDGRMCVAGKNMLDPSQYDMKTIGSILENCDEKEVFKPEAVGKLSPNDWGILQTIHDDIAKNNERMVELGIEKLGLFTLEELQNYKPLSSHHNVGFSTTSGIIPPPHRTHTDEDDGKQFTDQYGRTYTYLKGKGLIY